MRLRKFTLVGALVLAGCSARPGGSPQVSVTNAWSRATVRGQTAAAAYVTITNHGDGDDRLTKVSTPIGSASVHSTSVANGVMRMRPLAALAIAAHSTVELKPDQTHIMIMNIKQPLQPGSRFPLILVFDRSGARTVTVAVRPATFGGDGM